MENFIADHTFIIVGIILFGGGYLFEKRLKIKSTIQYVLFLFQVITILSYYSNGGKRRGYPEGLVYLYTLFPQVLICISYILTLAIQISKKGKFETNEQLEIISRKLKKQNFSRLIIASAIGSIISTLYIIVDSVIDFEYQNEPIIELFSLSLCSTVIFLYLNMGFCKYLNNFTTSTLRNVICQVIQYLTILFFISFSIYTSIYSKYSFNNNTYLVITFLTLLSSIIIYWLTILDIGGKDFIGGLKKFSIINLIAILPCFFSISYSNYSEYNLYDFLAPFHLVMFILWIYIFNKARIYSKKQDEK